MPPTEATPPPQSHPQLQQPQTQPAIQIPPAPIFQLTPQQQQQILNDPALAQLPGLQRTLVLALAERTGLNVSYSIQCLDGNGWDPAKAFVNFEQVRVSILWKFLE